MIMIKREQPESYGTIFYDCKFFCLFVFVPLINVLFKLVDFKRCEDNNNIYYKILQQNCFQMGKATNKSRVLLWTFQQSYFAWSFILRAERK